MNNISAPLSKHLYSNNKGLTALAANFWEKVRKDNIEFVDISRNSFESISFPSEPLPHVKVLELSYNQTSIRELNIDASIFPNLRCLYLYDSKVERLVVDGYWAYLEDISIEKNPITNIESAIKEGGVEALKADWKRINDEKVLDLPDVINTSVKLLIVGNSTAGKSTLLDWLKQLSANESYVFNDKESTHWLEQQKLEFKLPNGNTISLNVFDFGGQDFYHDTHHLFFSDQSAYLLLWDTKSNCMGESELRHEGIPLQHYPLRYWLSAIRYYSQQKEKLNMTEAQEEKRPKSKEQENEDPNKAKQQPTSPASTASQNEFRVFIIQNKVDKPKDLSLSFEQDLLAKKYSFIKDYSAVSFKEYKRLELLKLQLYDFLEAMPILGREVSATREAVRLDLKTRADTFTSAMSIDYFIEYCNQIIEDSFPKIDKKKIKILHFTRETAPGFAGYLNRIGQVLYFGDNEVLKDKVFVNQEQIVKQIYKILEGVEKKGGYFDNTHIQAALPQLKTKDLPTIVALMKEFKIIFEHPDAQTRQYIAPLYLSSQPIQGVSLFLDTFKTPIVRYEYQAFIHKSIILEFFQEYGKNALQEIRQGQDFYYLWRNGIVLKTHSEQNNEETVLVLVRFFLGSNEEKAHIDIYCNQAKKVTTYLNTLKNKLNEINMGWEVSEQVTVNGKDFIGLAHLHKMEEDNQWLFRSDNDDDKKHYNLTDFQAYLKNPLPMKKIFISYSRHDVAYKDALLKHLEPLRRKGLIATWNDRNIRAGEDWDNRIREELEAADIIICLFSSDFFATDYIWDVEIKHALERKDSKDEKKKPLTIFGILVRPCDWKSTPFRDIQMGAKKTFKGDNKDNHEESTIIISTHSDYDDAWMTYIKELKRIIAPAQ